VSFQVVFDCTRLPGVTTQVVSTVQTGPAIALTVALLFLLGSAFLGHRRLGELRTFAGVALITGAYALVYYAFLPRSTHLVSETADVPAVCRAPRKVVEGTVASFVPMPREGHAMEHFCVQEVCFDYSDYMHTGGFNNTRSHGGPISASRSVRVTYAEGGRALGNVIVRLEVDTPAS
jgi:hypothetical protein